MSIKATISKPIAKPIFQRIDKLLNGNENDFLIPNPENTYQGVAGQYAFTGDFPSLTDSFDFQLTVMVIAHNQTVRPVVGQCSAFDGATASVNWRLMFEADDSLTFGIRDALDAIQTVSVTVDEGFATTITGSYDSASGLLSLSNGTDTDTATIANRQAADADTPYLVLGDGAASGIDVQVREITVTQTNGVDVRWPCAEKTGLVMKDYVAADLESNTNGTLSSEELHAARYYLNFATNSVFAGSRGSVGEGDWASIPLWTEQFWPPDDAIALGAGQLQFITQDNRGYLGNTWNATDYVGQLVNASIFVDDFVPSDTASEFQRPIHLTGDAVLVDNRDNNQRSVGRKNAVYEITGNNVFIRVGAGTTAARTQNLTISRPQVTLGTEMLPFKYDLQSIFNPLEASPDWELVGGTNATLSQIDGLLIRLSNNGGALEQAVCLVDSTTVDGGITFNLERLGTGTNTATFLGAVRVTSSNDFIGVRTYANELQVYERIGGVWGDFVSTPNPALGSEIELIAEGANVRLYVNGTLELEYTTNIRGAGARGMILRSWPNTLQPAVSNVRLVETNRTVTFVDTFTDTAGTLLTAHTPDFGAGWLNQGSELGITTANTAQARGTGTGTGNPNYHGNLMDVPAPVGRKLIIFNSSSAGGTSLAQGFFCFSDATGQNKVICGIINANMVIQSWQASSLSNMETIPIPDGAGQSDAPFPQPFYVIIDGDLLTMGYGDWQNPTDEATVDTSVLTGLGTGMGLIMRASGPEGIYDIEYSDV